MRYFFILNPGSKSGSSRGLFDKIFNILDKEKITYHHVITNSLEDAYTFSKDANLKGYDVIVAVGGDGTINRVLRGFFKEDGKRISKARMGVVYTGTSPDFCKSYGIPTDVDNAVKVIIENRSTIIQVGKITLAKKFMPQYNGKGVEYGDQFDVRYFACCANIGLGAALARTANSGIRGVLGDYLGTFTALLKTLFRYSPSDFYGIVDGERETLKKVHNISIGRTYYIASGIKVKHDLKENYGVFYRLTVKNMNLWNCLKIIKRVYSGKIIKNDNVTTLDYIRKIEILGNNINPEVEFDGDPGGFLPCSIEMAEEGLNLICGTEV